MYVKVFESRQSSKSYLLQYRLSGNQHGLDKYYIENELHESMVINETELFKLFDLLFKGKQNEAEKIRCEERRGENDGSQNQGV